MALGIVRFFAVSTVSTCWSSIVDSCGVEPVAVTSPILSRRGGMSVLMVWDMAGKNGLETEGTQ